ncbi:MAG: hypothetical protein JSW67_14715 [Candidatus Latescibacterota bacterium]|nr:MAG: hypothetical protein JSW67_14715 [Candidatus Latescibacterota bacterium]
MRWLHPLAFLFLAEGVLAEPCMLSADFDVDGDGTRSPALKLLRINTANGEALRLSQPLRLDADRSYCVGFDWAVENIASERRSVYHIETRVGPEQRVARSDLVDGRGVWRGHVEFLVHPQAAEATEFSIAIHHDNGPVDDPALYLDAIRVVPIVGPKLQHTFAEEHWMEAGSVLGWEHDFAAQGVRVGDAIGLATIELVAWDDEPDSNTDGLEVFELLVNGIVAESFDLDGRMEAPHRIMVHTPWIECNDDFDGVLQVRLRSIPKFESPPGDFYFGAAHAVLVAGEEGDSLLHNGDFDTGIAEWTSNGVPCEPTPIRRATWSQIKVLYR